jgi:hypothetical protein
MKQATNTAVSTQTGQAEPVTEFVAVTGGGETTSATTMLVLAYLLMWAVLFAFVWLSLKKQRSLASKLSELETVLTKAESRQG